MDDNEETEDSEPTLKETKVEIHHRVNRLKRKAGGDMKGGAGYFAADAINRAQTVIDEKEEEYPVEVEEIIHKIVEVWKTARETEGDERAEALDVLQNAANHIKDIADMFHYDLMRDFAASLRDFCEKIDVNNKPHHTIVKAHINVMQIAYNENIRDEVGDKAEELKLVLKQAIEKYS